MVKGRTFINLLFFLGVFLTTVDGHSFLGKRIVRTYLPSDYSGGTQNWAICADTNNWLYFGNQGILIYDGFWWNKAVTRNGSAVRAITLGPDGKIYYGAINEFGVLSVDSKGKYSVEVLSNDIEFKRPDVWSLHAVGKQQISFQTENRIFIFNGKTFKTIDPEGSFFYLTYKVDQTLWALDVGVGLQMITDTALVFISGSEFLKNQRLEALLTDSKNTLTFILRSGKIYRAEYDNKPSLRNLRELPLLTNAPTTTLGLYTGYQFSDELIAIGTTQQGLLLIDTLGNVKYNANINNQLLSDAVYAIHVTPDGVMWLAQDMGIALIEMGPEISLWDHTLGLKGTVYKLLIFRNKLYAATSYGLFVTESKPVTGEPHRFRQIEGLRSQTWDIAFLSSQKDTILLAAAGDGFYQITSRAQKISETNSCYSLAVCQKSKNPVVMLGHGKGISFFEYRNNSFVELPIRADIQASVRKMLIDNQDQVWVSTPYTGIASFSLQEVQKLKPIIPLSKYALDSAESFRLADLAILNNELMVIINGRLFKPIKETLTLKPSYSLNKFLKERDIPLGIIQFDHNTNTAWINGEYKIQNFGNPDFSIEHIPINRFDISFIHQFLVSGDHLFFATEKGLYGINIRNFIPQSKLNPPIVRGIYTSADSIFFIAKPQPISFRFPVRNLKLQFSSSNYLAGEKIRFRFRLNGFEKEYSQIENQFEKTYSNLLPGNYQFVIFTIDGYGRVSSPTYLNFTVEAPWYLTIYAIIIYLSAIVVMITIIIRRRTKRLHSIRKYLQEEVRERTREIARQHQQLKKLSLIVEKADNAVSVFSKEGKLLWCNNAFTRIYGYTVDEFIATKGKQIFSTHESPQVREAYEQCLQTKQTVRYEFFTLNRFEEGIWIQTTLTPILDKNNQIKQLIAIDTDVTNLKNADEEIRFQKEQLERINAELIELSIIAQETDNAVVVSDKDGFIIWVNRAYTKIYGYTTEEMVSAKVNILDLTSNDELKHWLKHWPSNRESIQYDSQNPTKDGKIIWAHTTVTPVRGANGQIYRFIGVDSDITRLKQAEEEIAWQKQELEKLNATKDKFFSIIGHDLRSPFGNFVGITNLLLQNFHSYNKEQLLQFIIRLNRSAQNSYSLLENLLAWARSQRNSVELNIQHNNLSSLIRECVELLAPFAERKNLEIISEFPETVDVLCDDDSIRLVIRNLLFNALKYTPSGGKITIKVFVQDKKAVVQVIDTGVGISEENLKKLFRIDIVHSTLGTDNERGTGLGLILCADFVQRNKGEIGVVSKEGSGSTFWFSLPALY